MSYNVSVERDNEQILAIYIRIRDGHSAKTVEIAEGACYADEDEEGNLLGVEMLAPGEVKINMAAVKEHYTHPAVREVLDRALDTVRI